MFKTCLNTLLLFSCSIIPLSGLYDEFLAPKWYAAIFMLLTMICVDSWNSIHQRQDTGRKDILALPALIILAYNIVYVCVFDLIPIHGYHDLHIHGTFANPVGYALNTCILIAMVPWKSKEKKRQIATMIILVVAGITVLLSESRTGLMSLAAVACFRLCSNRKINSWKKVVVSVAVLTTIVISLVLIKQESSGGRWFILGRTWELIEERPLTGYGYHGFERNYMLQQAAYFNQHPDSEAAWYADDISHPLNEFMYLWVCFGVLAPLLLLLLFIMPVWICKKNKFIKLDFLQPLVVIVLFSLFSYPHIYPIAWVALALVYKHLLRVCTVSRRICWIPLVLSVFLFFVMFHNMWYEHQWSKANNAVKHGYTRYVIGIYDKLYTYYTYNAKFLYSYMYAQFQERRFYEALNTYSQLQEKTSTYDMELLAGDACRHLQRTSEALTHYQFAHAMVPVRFAPLEGMMYSYLDAGRNYEADSVAHIILSKPVKVPSLTVDQIKEEARKVRNALSQ